MRRADVSRRAALVGLAAAALPRLSAAQPVPSHEISIAAKQIGHFSKTSQTAQFGPLTFLGGLTLSSAEREFGGLSGLAMEPDGRSFVAVSDEGAWLTAQVSVDGQRPIGIEAARLGSILGADGVPYKRKRDKDCEAVAILDGTLQQGILLMAFERNHRIERFPVRNRIVQPSTGVLPMPRDGLRMEANKGLEAMTVMSGGPFKGAVVAFSERSLDADGNHTGWLWIDGTPQRIGLRALGGFDLTDVAALPDGALIVLERRFRWTEGVKLQLRLIPLAEITPGRVAEGRVLLTVDNTHEIDNMEGLSTHRESDGTQVLTLISDDNFSQVLQRTVLLRFALNV